MSDHRLLTNVPQHHKKSDIVSEMRRFQDHCMALWGIITGTEICPVLYNQAQLNVMTASEKVSRSMHREEDIVTFNKNRLTAFSLILKFIEHDDTLYPSA